MSKLKICVFGLWHLGCVTAACLADLGFEVVGLDTDEKNIKQLSEGKVSLFEPGLDEMIAKNLEAKRLSFTSDPKEALSGVSYLWVCFDTPVNENDEADTDLVLREILKAVKFLDQDCGVIISSQMPVGSTQKVKELVRDQKINANDLKFAYSPENLRLGSALDVFLNPDRIIFGVNKHDQEYFRPLLEKITNEIKWMRIESAEMTKHAINSFLAMSVAFANELAVICEQVGADANEVAGGLKSEQRIGRKAYVAPGQAFSGGTLARDIMFLGDISDELGIPSTLLKSVKVSNDLHKDWVKNKVLQLYGDQRDIKIGVLGLTYKPNTNTLRRSLSIELCKKLNALGFEVNAYDPVIDQINESDLEFISLRSNLGDLFKDSDCIIVSTLWDEFKDMDGDLLGLLAKKTFIDPGGKLSNLIKDNTSILYYNIGGSPS